MPLQGEYSEPFIKMTDIYSRGYGQTVIPKETRSMQRA